MSILFRIGLYRPADIAILLALLLKDEETTTLLLYERRLLTKLSAENRENKKERVAGLF